MSRLDEWRKELDEKTMQAVYEDRHSAKLFNGFGPKEVGEVELPITKVTSKTLDIIKEAQELTIEALNYYTKDEILGKLEEIKKTIKPGLTEEEVNTKLEGYYTKPTVDGKIEEVEGKVDEKLSDYYTIPQTDNKLKEYYTKPDVDLKFDNYYKKHEVDQKDVEIRENIKETILNTNELSHYYTQEKTNDLLDDLYGNFMFYYKKEEVDQLLADLEIPEVDLSDYYTKPEVDDKLENLEIPEVDLSDYYTKPEVDAKLETIDLTSDFYENEIKNIIEDEYTFKEIHMYYVEILDKNKGLHSKNNLKLIVDSADVTNFAYKRPLGENTSVNFSNIYTYKDKQYRYLGYIYNNIYYPRENVCNIYFINNGVLSLNDTSFTIPNIRNERRRNYVEVYLIYEELPPEPAE